MLGLAMRCSTHCSLPDSLHSLSRSLCSPALAHARHLRARCCALAIHRTSLRVLTPSKIEPHGKREQSLQDSREAAELEAASSARRLLRDGTEGAGDSDVSASAIHGNDGGSVAQGPYRLIHSTCSRQPAAWPYGCAHRLRGDVPRCAAPPPPWDCKPRRWKLHAMHPHQRVVEDPNSNRPAPCHAASSGRWRGRLLRASTWWPAYGL